RASANNGAKAHLVMYGEQRVSSSGNVETARSRAAAIVRALGARGAARTVLVWHLDLAKLLPCVRRRATRVFIYLHGVEAFRHLDWLTRVFLVPSDVFLTNSDYTWGRFAQANPAFSQALHTTVSLGLHSPAPALRPASSPPAALMIGRMQQDEDY